MTPSIAKHLQKYPNARASTLAALIERDKVRAQLEIEAAFNRRRQRVQWFKGLVLWPKYVWRG